MRLFNAGRQTGADYGFRAVFALLLEFKQNKVKGLWHAYQSSRTDQNIGSSHAFRRAVYAALRCSWTPLSGMAGSLSPFTVSIFCICIGFIILTQMHFDKIKLHFHEGHLIACLSWIFLLFIGLSLFITAAKIIPSSVAILNPSPVLRQPAAPYSRWMSFPAVFALEGGFQLAGRHGESLCFWFPSFHSEYQRTVDCFRGSHRFKPRKNRRSLFGYGKISLSDLYQFSAAEFLLLAPAALSV